MKIAAVAAEYNPFHKGHEYQLQEIRRISSADFIVVVMSGNFVQRGAPAIWDKYTRSAMAVSCGADLVLELPVFYSTGSAGEFAEGIIRVLEALGNVEELWFGSESGEIETFFEIASILAEEPPSFTAAMKKALAEGKPYPAARQAGILSAVIALSEESLSAAHISTSNGLNTENIIEFLKQPNNILGLEYVLALKKHGSEIRPCTIQRKGGGYHSGILTDGFPSATAIRRVIYKNTESANASFSALLADAIPAAALSCLKKDCMPLKEDDFSLLLHERLLALDLDADSSKIYPAIPLELFRRIVNDRNQFRSWTDYISLIKTRNYTYTAVSRALTRILLDIKTSPRQNEICGLRILALRSDRMHALHGRSSSLPPLFSGPAEFSDTYADEIHAANLYEMVRANHSEDPFRHELTRKIFII